ncbi:MULTISPECIES: type II toxin-antitoxin system HipA family toxin [unclassified Oceanispirochaeta]|uniref:type II toxin-antitoxin system HipA family toxin n=1 Tax=unclassified Oceanispirochaeta TaxID=2635722 RepID=UPI000E097737|nr:MULTISPECIES: type II toxin-antitoxin system HipA family toxin [unclassified Oceanispirochaeta]MBF9015974.1 type II toxin-antitoxin system HipA family toxin [Oceanispirochaeta sp. M2]NPD72437.1 type II toxin-antitoxin system HipA family toxin [Oceanispirochaeta sp. M1]RDG32204.1 type II toxin-antitoxin system HipA family toxin [Oceanispirochaeta sp. M1]
MGRRAEKRSLAVWMNGIYVGEWGLAADHEFHYDSGWLSRKESRPLSISLPLTSARFKGLVVESFFDNLLPDAEEIRQRLRSRYSLSSKSAFDLLYEIGRDCVGAIQLLPPDVKPENLKSIHGTAADEVTLGNLLLSRCGGLLRNSGDRDFRISLAGSQEKTAFLLQRKQWMVPIGTTPTTHIFKLPLGRIGDGNIDLSSSVENEWLCSRILSLFGMDTAQCSIDSFNDVKVLIVERFDRRFSEDRSWIIRLPQEDFCQAAGIPSALKYECDGGPGIVEIMNKLRGSVLAEKDRRTFFKSQILFFLLAATDGHAKNFSISLLPGSRYRLTPLYDVLSLYPVLGSNADEVHPKRAKMAMAVYEQSGKTYRWDQICRSHWYYTAKAAGFPVESCTELLEEVLQALPGVISTVHRELPDNFPNLVSTRILNGMEDAARRLIK